jgi:putative hydrolase of the HAD superfamily
MRGVSAAHAVLFDFGGTLDAAGVPWKERIVHLYREEGIDIAAERFAPLFYRADDALVGTIPSTLSFRDTVHRLVAGVSAGLNVTDGAVTMRVATRFVERSLAAIGSSAPVLARLARRYRLGLVSNFYGNLETVCADVGLDGLFTVIVDSARVGCTKPDPRIFHRALDGVGVAPGEATFVGDSPTRDMAGARGVGMRHVWLVPPDARPTACCPGDRVVRSLAELEEWLR